MKWELVFHKDYGYGVVIDVDAKNDHYYVKFNNKLYNTDYNVCNLKDLTIIPHLEEE